jgi:hypothetical protein
MRLIDNSEQVARVVARECGQLLQWSICTYIFLQTENSESLPQMLYPFHLLCFEIWNLWKQTVEIGTKNPRCSWCSLVTRNKYGNKWLIQFLSCMTAGCIVSPFVYLCLLPLRSTAYLHCARLSSLCFVATCIFRDAFLFWLYQLSYGGL